MICDVVFAHCFSGLVALIQYGSDGHDLKKRTLFFHLIRKVPLLCREGRSASEGHVTYPYIIFYELHRVYGERIRNRNPILFLDRVPTHVRLLSGPHGPEAPAAILKTFTADDADMDRISTNDVLQDANDAKLQKMQTMFYASDLPQGVPLRVSIFVGRARYVARGMLHTQADSFQPCSSSLCSNMAYILDHPVTKDGVQTEDESLFRRYWKAAGGRTTAEEYAEQQRLQFCSRNCRCDVLRDIRKTMGFKEEDLYKYDAPSDAPAGTKRAISTFASAVKRNAMVARAIRESKRADDTRALKTITLVNIRRSVCRMLNTDLGLTYAAQSLVESHSLMRGRLIPSVHVGWRLAPNAYLPSLERIKKLKRHKKVACDEELVTSVICPPKWMASAVNNATVLFPQSMS